MRSLLVSLALLIYSAASGADTYPVAGIIINAQTGTPMPGAQVALYQNGTKLAGAMHADPGGTCQLI